MVGKTHDHGTESLQQQSTNDSTSDEHRSLKDKLKNPFSDLRDKMKDSSLYDAKVKAIHLKHRIGKMENLFNHNHRHDEAHEQATDAKRTKIAEGHRFQSFFPERDGNLIKWYVDGRDYYHAVSIALENAKESIYIEDWWLSPELFLRRPPHTQQKWRLDHTIKRAAERGVKIYVFLYKEVTAALTCNSEHSKHTLEQLCPEGTPGYKNIVVMRHPDHNFFENAGDMTFYWAHHEKFIVIDYDTAFIGGLDLCFGRWDNKQHPLADAHPTNVQNEIFPGQDFNNNRIMDFQTVDDWKSNELSKTEYGRMPWHDVAMGLVGPCVYDIAEHFILRWNFAKRDKYKRDDEYDWLTLTGRTGEDEDLVGVQRPKHPVGEYIQHPLSALEHKRGNPNLNLNLVESQQQAGPGAHSDGEDEFHDAPETPGAHGYVEGQHRTPQTWLSDGLHEGRIHRPNFQHHKTSEKHPGEAHGNQSSGQEHDKMTGNDTKKEGTVSASGGVTEKLKSYSSDIVDYEAPGGYGTLHAQIVRSSADWSSGILTDQSIQNAYCQAIRGARHYVYIENQFFITATGEEQSPVHNLIGKAIVDACAAADKEGRTFRVIVIMPAIPGFAGDLRSDAAAGTRAIMDYQYKSISRGEHSIFGQLTAQGVDPAKYIFVFNLRSYDRINNTPESKKQEKESGVKYQHLQRAQAEEVMGSGVHGTPGEHKSKRAEAKRKARKGGHATGLKGLLSTKKQAEAGKAESSSESESDEEDGPPAGAQDKKQEDEQQNENQPAAKRGEDAADKREELEQRREDEKTEGRGKDDGKQISDSIAHNAMLDGGKVSDEVWAGRGGGQQDGMEENEAREQEKENFIQEQLYIHAKVSLRELQ